MIRYKKEGLDEGRHVIRLETGQLHYLTDADLELLEAGGGLPEKDATAEDVKGPGIHPWADSVTGKVAEVKAAEAKAEEAKAQGEVAPLPGETLSTTDGQTLHRPADDTTGGGTPAKAEEPAKVEPKQSPAPSEPPAAKPAKRPKAK